MEVHYDLSNSQLEGPLLDFRNVLTLTWRALGLPDPTPAQLEIAYFLQHGPDPSKPPWEPPNNSLILEAFRGVGKSWIAGVFVPWFEALNPVKHESLVASAAAPKANQFSSFVHRLLSEVPVFNHLVPDRPQKWSSVEFDVAGHMPSQVGSVRSLGVMSAALTGGRADLIVPDDIEVPNTSETQTMREKVRHRITEFDLVKKPDSRVIFLGTPHYEDTLYDHLVRQGYRRLILPARYPDENWMRRYGHELSPRLRKDLEDDPSLVGKPTDPTRFNEEDLLQREARIGKTHFSIQMMLDTQPSDAAKRPLRVSDLVVADLNPEVAPDRVVWSNDPQSEWKNLPNLAPDGDRFYRPLNIATAENGAQPHSPYASKVLYVDPSGRGKDETAWSVLGFLHGNLFLLKIGASPGGYEEHVLQAIAKDAAWGKVNVVLVEDNLGQGMFANLLHPVLQKVHQCGIEPVRSSRQKEVRVADTLEPVMNQHRLIVNREIIEWDHEAIQQYDFGREDYSLVYQMTRLTRDKGCLVHDDRLEAVSGGVAHFVDAVAQDTEKQAREAAERAMLDEINQHVIHCGGSPNETTSFSTNRADRTRIDLHFRR